MSAVTPFKKKKPFRECPQCGYLISQSEIQAFRYPEHMRCPRCRVKGIDEFVQSTKFFETTEEPRA